MKKLNNNNLLARGKYFLMLVLLVCGPFTAPVHAATRYEIGIATSATLLRMNDKDLNKRLTDMQQMGTTWIRVDFSWHAIQPNNATDYDWEMYDRVVRRANEHKLKILAVLDYTPQWARESRCATLLAKDEDSARKCNPRSTEEFGHFAAVASHRYKGTNVRAWEIWNEPNLSAYWKTVQPDNKTFVDPEVYAKLANAAAAQIRAHYRDSVIITGGLSPLFEAKYPVGMRQSDFLAQVLPRLKPELFDGVAMHPYCWPVMPAKTAVYNAFYTVDNGKPEYNLRTVMRQAGWEDKEMWGTEFGASTKGLRSVTTKKGRPDHVSEDMQAQITKQGIDDWYNKPNVGPIFVHSDSDQWLVAVRNEGGFGMRRSDGTKKPSYDAFVAATRRISHD